MMYAPTKHYYEVVIENGEAPEGEPLLTEGLLESVAPPCVGDTATVLLRGSNGCLIKRTGVVQEIL